MRKSLWFCLVSVFILSILSSTALAQWAQNKNAREDAIYARVIQGTDSVTIDGVEDAIWAKADSVVLGYGVTKLLPSSGYKWVTGDHVAGDSANVVFKCLYKSPYLYLLFKVEDKNVGGVDWEQSDGMIISFKSFVDNNTQPKTHDLTGKNPWDFRVEHFPTFAWKWAGDATQPAPGSQPILKGDIRVQGGGDTTLTKWMQHTSVIGGNSYDSSSAQSWISEHRIKIDPMGFNLNGDVIPFSFCMWDGDGFMDSSATNNRFSKVWWGNEWNETWYYNALFIDPNVTTTSAGGVIPPVDYTIPRLRSGDAITVNGDLSEWKQDNTLHFKAKWGNEAGFDSVKGTGDWSSGYKEDPWNGAPIVGDGPDVDYWVTYDDANLYVSAKVNDQIVTVPDTAKGNTKYDGITFYMVGRNYIDGTGIMGNVKALTVNVDSSGAAKAGDDLIGMADTAGVTYKLMLGSSTVVNDHNNVDNGYTVEMKIPFASFDYPTSLGDSVVFIGGSVHDLDVFDDAASDYYASSWWFKYDKGQTSPAWVALGPANPVTGINDRTTLPVSFQLYDNYPNPFNPSTNISFSLPHSGNVDLKIYNTLGQLVTSVTLANQVRGKNTYRFNASALASGVYFYRITLHSSSGEVLMSKAHKMILLK